MILFTCIRAKYFVAFYRYNVMSSNIFIVIVQCCYVGISILYTITRLIILTLMALIYAGRYDCLFLAPGIDILRKFLSIYSKCILLEYLNILNYICTIRYLLDLDSMPETFLKDILIHEGMLNGIYELVL